MQSHSTRPLCRCGCGVPAHRDTGLARGQRPCQGTPEQQFWARVARGDDCWTWLGTLKEAGSYGRFLTAGGWVRAHRWAWTHRSGEPIPGGFDVLHTCDNPPCVRDDEPGIYIVRGIARPRWGHLWLGTHQDNMADRMAKGRYPEKRRREPIIIAKLSDDDVREIRRLLGEGVSHRKIADLFGVSKGAITPIARGVSYKHVR